MSNLLTYAWKPKVIAFRRIWRSNRLTSKVPSLRAKKYCRSIKFQYYEKATKFCPSSTYNFTQPFNVRKRVEDWPNFLTFSEYLNFKAGARGASTSARAAFVSVLVLWQRKYFWQSPLNYSRLSWNCSATVVCIIVRTEEIILKVRSF